MQYWTLVALAGDVAVIVVCLLFGFWVKFSANLVPIGIQTPGMRLGDYAGHIAFGVVCEMMLLFYTGVYRRFFVLHFRSALLAILQATIVWIAFYLGLSLMLRIQPALSRIFVMIAGLALLVLLPAWRVALRAVILSLSRSSLLRQRILLVGWSPSISRFWQALRQERRPMQVVVGCHPTATSRELPPKEVPEIADWGDVCSSVRGHDVDMVIVGDPSLPAARVLELASLCERFYVPFKLIPSYFEILLSRLQTELVGNTAVLGIADLPLDVGLNRVLKRCVDILGGLMGLVLSAPLIAICGVLVYYESPGPILYRQRRIGRHGRPFVMYKIRSMRLDAEAEGPRWADPTDLRRLRIGTFMRRWNLDETPQFWNVLRGDMSLVGPRPERPELIETFQASVPHYNARHSCKPGMTGWAQVHGLRGNTDLAQRIQHDLYYVENWSIWLDVYIILITLLIYDNAY